MFPLIYKKKKNGGGGGGEGVMQCQLRPALYLTQTVLANLYLNIPVNTGEYVTSWTILTPRQTNLSKLRDLIFTHSC